MTDPRLYGPLADVGGRTRREEAATTEALDKAEAALAEWDAANARLVRIWYANHHHLADALRALVTEHRRLLAELDEAHAHFQVQEARIRALTEAGPWTALTPDGQEKNR